MQGKKKYVVLVLFLLIGLMVVTFANPSEDEEKNKKLNKDDEIIEEIEDDEELENQPEDKDDIVLNPVNNFPINNNLVNNNQNMNNVIIPDEDITKDAYAEALEAVEKAEETLDINDYNEALSLVNALNDSNVKDELLERLENVLSSIDAIELVSNLETMVNEAQNFDDMNNARAYDNDNAIKEVVNSLTDQLLKENLNNRLNALNGLLSDIEEPIINGLEDGDIVNSLVDLSIEDDNDYTITLNGEVYEIGNELEQDGQYVLIVVDAAFNETTITFTYDTTAPIATIKFSNDNELTNENVTVTLTASEPVLVSDGWTRVDDVTFVKIYEQNMENESVTITDLAGNTTVMTYNVEGIVKEEEKDLDFVIDGSTDVIFADRINSDNPISVNDMLDQVFEGKNISSKRINQIDVIYSYTSKTGSVQSINCVLEINSQMYVKKVEFTGKYTGNVVVSFTDLQLDSNDSFTISSEMQNITNGNISITESSIAVHFED